MSTWNVISGVARRTLKNALTNPQILLPTMAFPVLLHRVRGRALQLAQVPASTFRRATRRSSSSSYSSSPRRSAASSRASGSRGTSRAGSRSGSCSRRRGEADRPRIRARGARPLVGRRGAAHGRRVRRRDEHRRRPVDLVGLFTLAALVNFCGFFWAGGIAMRFRTIQAAPLMQMPGLPDPLLRAGLRAARAARGLDHGVAAVNPVTYVLETGRGFVAGDAPHIAGAFAIAHRARARVLGLGVPRLAECRGRGRVGEYPPTAS